MPTRLARPRSLRRLQAKRAQALVVQYRAEQRGPWGGYVPDIDASLLSLKDCSLAQGLVDKGGVLGPDDGWQRIDTTHLPLPTIVVASSADHGLGFGLVRIMTSTEHGWETGTSVVISGHSVSGYNGTWTITRITTLTFDLQGSVWTANGTGGRANSAEALVGFASWRNRDTQVLGQFAFTGRHLQQLDTATAQWVNRGYVLGTARLTGEAQYLVDSAFYTLQNTMIFTNDKDVVFRYPDAGASSRYEEAFTGGGINPLVARSVTVFGDRVLMFNTSENGTQYPNRVRWTAINSFSLTATGAGSLDLADLNGEGVRILPISDLCVCYGAGGVAVLRRQLLPTDPFAREYITDRRGLLSTHSVVDIGGGIHFGLFTDGWFFFDVSGRWTEAGIFRVPDGRVYHKWVDAFYNRLNWDQRARVVIQYDQHRRIIRIAFPSGSGQANPNVVWLYDVEGDRLFTDDYGASLTPNIWGTMSNINSTSATWDSVDPLAIWDGFSGSWASLEPAVGRAEMVFGTTSGLPMKFNYNGTVTRDGSLPTYVMQTKPNSLGSEGAWKVGDRIKLTYRRLQRADGTEPTPISVSWQSDQPTTTVIPLGGTVAQTEGAIGTAQVGTVAARVAGERLGINISGQHPVEIIAFEPHFDIQGTEDLED